MYVKMCIYIIQVYIYMRICTFIYIVSVCLYMFICTYMCMCIYTYIGVRKEICTQISALSYTH